MATKTVDNRQLRSNIQKKYSALLNVRTNFDAMNKNITKYIIPHKGRYDNAEGNDGSRKDLLILNNTATRALNTLSSGMVAGVTNPTRPWFKLGIGQAGLQEFGDVKDWLENVEKKMREILTSSNFYGVMPDVYKELGSFGTTAVIMDDDFKDVVRFYPVTAGEYVLGVNDRNEVDTLIREFQMTVGQMVSKFGKDNVSEKIKISFERKETEQLYNVVHAIEPNVDRVIGMKDSRNKLFRSVYYEAGSDNHTILGIFGYDEFPVLAARWSIGSGDTYGTDSPGISTLGDVKQLQHEEMRKAEAIDKLVNPPVNIPQSLKNSRTSTRPGGSNFYNDVGGSNNGVTPVYQIDPRLQDLKEDIFKIEERIKESFFANLFLAMTDIDRRQITATEIDARKQEKLLMLGPVLERLNNDILDPLIERMFNIMFRKGIIPPPPQEIQGQALNVEYISVMAQAQRSVGKEGIVDTVGFVASLAELDPDVLDKIDFDQAVDEHAERSGVPPKIIRGDDEVIKIRDARNEANLQNAQMNQAAQATEIAKSASQAKTGDEENLLTDAQDILGSVVQ